MQTLPRNTKARHEPGSFSLEPLYRPCQGKTGPVEFRVASFESRVKAGQPVNGAKRLGKISGCGRRMGSGDAIQASVAGNGCESGAAWSFWLVGQRFFRRDVSRNDKEETIRRRSVCDG